MAKSKVTTDGLRKRIVTLAFSRVVKESKTPKLAAEYSQVVKQLANRTKKAPGSIRLWARRQAYRREEQHA